MTEINGFKKNKPGIDIRKNRGLSLLELLIAAALTGMIMLSINGIIGLGLQSQALITEKNESTRQAKFAMQKMVQAIQQSPRLLLPLVDSPLTTDRNEAVRGDKDTPGKETEGILAITMSHTLDQDGNGTPDADNDGDGLFDEDLPADNNNDNRGGIANIDDDKDGIPDLSFSSKIDDDEDFEIISLSPFQSAGEDEDPIDGEDNDEDGSIDEDAPADMNGDTCPGICGKDDDGDGEIDEGAAEDDDEDGQSDEDWYDAIVFYVNNGSLYQRIPVPWDENGDSAITGQDYVEAVLAENVSVFTVERLVQGDNRAQLLDLTLELAGSSGEKISLNVQTRLGGAL